MRVAIVVLIFMLFSCTASKERRRCAQMIGDSKALEIENFYDFKNYLEIVDESLTDILWIIDGVPILGDTIVSEIDKKDYDILSIDKINKSILISIYANKDWSFAILVTTNKCLNKDNQ